MAYTTLSSLVSSLKKAIDQEIKRYLREAEDINPQDIRDYGLELIAETINMLPEEIVNHILKKNFTLFIPFIKFHLEELGDGVKKLILTDYCVGQLADYIEPKLEQKPFQLPNIK